MENFSPQSKIWIYQSDQFFSQDQEEQIRNILHNFIQHWHAHHQKLKATFEIRYHLFVIFIIDEDTTAASGCSIDSSVKIIKEIQDKFGFNFFNRTMIAYKENNSIQLCNMEAFQEKILSSHITDETIVFNNLVPTLTQFKQEWEIPAKESWHQKVFQFN